MAFIIGTAGHIDHGKTSLIRALTGVDLDSAPEEQDRGITISLGFTSLQVGEQSVSFIDVPGHERLIRTMIAGATSLDAVLLCVSATDSVMPQTIEHVNILQLLGVQHGLIAITMCDLADEEDIELITEELHELVEGTFLEGAPIIETVAGESPSGLDALTRNIEALISKPRPQVQKQPFRLPIDRVFSQKGFGTVVTGTARGQSVANGSTVSILPEDIEAKIRNIQLHGSSVEETQAGRIALNLSGVSVDTLSRGSVVIVPNSLPVTQIVDIEYQHLDDATALSNGTRVRILFGSSEALGKVYRIDCDQDFEAGDTGLLQLRLDSPHILCKADRCIIRRESPLETLGGGVVLDPYAIKIRKRNQHRQCTWLQETKENPLALIERVGRTGRTLQECHLLGSTEHIVLGTRGYAPAIVDDLISLLVEAVQDWHRRHPLKKGATKMELQQHFPFLDKTALGDLAQLTLSKGMVLEKNGRLHHPNFSVALTSDQERTIDNLLQVLHSKGLQGSPINDWTDIPKPLFQYALQTALVIRIENNIVAPTHINHLIGQLRTHFEFNTTLNTTEFKEMTQLSRKFSIPLLEWMDENQKTRRKDDVRIQGGMLSKDV